MSEQLYVSPEKLAYVYSKIKDEVYSKTEVDDLISSAGGGGSTELTYDIILTASSAAEYAGQTINKKTIFVKENISNTNISITFNNFILHGNKYYIESLGLMKFQNCCIYNLDIYTAIDSENGGAGSITVTGCELHGCGLYDYWNSGLSSCKAYSCILAGYGAGGQNIPASNCLLVDCDFQEQFYPTGYNISFINCKGIMGEYGTSLTGELYFSGCSGSVRIDSHATIRPSTSTLLQEFNFATFIIE